MNKLFLFMIMTMAFPGLNSFAATSDPIDEQPNVSAPLPGKVHYKQADDVNFEKLLIEGQLQKPSVTVVTGTVEKGGDGLLRLRKNFLDRVARDFGENAE